MINTAKCLAALCVVLYLSDNATADADIHPFLTDKFYIQVGAYYPTQELKIRYDASIGTENREVDFGNEFGLKESDDVFVLEVTWRFGKKWSLRMQHFQEDRRSGSVLEDDVEWGDVTIGAGSSVVTGSNFELTRMFFGRTFDSSPRHDFGVGLGIHRMETGAFIFRDIIVNFGETSAVSASGPLPNIGTWYSYSPAEKWYLGGRLDWFEASIGDYSGGLVNFAAGVNYQLFNHFGVGLNYQLFTLKADVKKTSWRGSINTTFEGLYVYLSGNW